MFVQRQLLSVSHLAVSRSHVNTEYGRSGFPLCVISPFIFLYQCCRQSWFITFIMETRSFLKATKKHFVMIAPMLIDRPVVLKVSHSNQTVVNTHCCGLSPNKYQVISTCEVGIRKCIHTPVGCFRLLYGQTIQCAKCVICKYYYYYMSYIIITICKT